MKFEDFYRVKYLQFVVLACLLVYVGYDKLFADLEFEYKSKGEVITLKVPRMYGQMTWGGNVVDSFKIPYAHMPIVDGYRMPVPDKGDSWGLLHIDALNRDFLEYKKIRRESLFRNINDVRKYIKIDSDVDGYDRYGPKNYENLGGITYYYVSDHRMMTCAKACRLKGFYNKHLIFTFWFPKSEIRNLDKIEQSVKVLINQFIVN